MLHSKSLFSSVSLILILAPQSLWGAACCGGSVSAPSLIINDSKSQLSLSTGYSEILTDVNPQGLWQKRQMAESSQSLKMDSAFLLSDRLQMGLGVSVLRRARASESAQGFGDLTTTLGYEYLTDWDYHPFRPKGIGFLQVTAPTGSSIHDSNRNDRLDSFGRGFWTLGFGTVLTKTISNFDGFSSLGVHYSFAKSISTEEFSGKISPGFGGDLSFGLGYNFKKLRLGGSLSLNYEDPIEASGSINSRGVMQRFSTGSLSASYLISETLGGSVIYSDQTLFGAPVNTSLSRSVLLQFQQKWAR